MTADLSDLASFSELSKFLAAAIPTFAGLALSYSANADNLKELETCKIRIRN